MHHRKAYMYINFQLNRVSRSVKTVHINLFAKNCKLHKFATTNSNFAKIDSVRHESSDNVHVGYINFQPNRFCRSVKTCTHYGV